MGLVCPRSALITASAWSTAGIRALRASKDPFAGVLALGLAAEGLPRNVSLRYSY